MSTATTEKPAKSPKAPKPKPPAKPKPATAAKVDTPATATPVPIPDNDVAGLFKLASDPTRVRVIMILTEGEKHVGALCDQLSQTQPAVSHHLALLRLSKVIVPRREGKNNFYSLTDLGRKLADVAKDLGA